MKDKDLLGSKVFLAERFRGKVKDFYIGRKGGQIKGIMVSKNLFSYTQVKRGHFSYDGKRIVLSPDSTSSTWKPSRRSIMKYSNVRYKELFAGLGWKIGRLETLHIDPSEWVVANLDAHVEHPLILQDVSVYSQLDEEKSVYGMKHFYSDAYSFKAGKIVEEMQDSDKARFLTDSGDSSIKGLGEASSLVSFPSEGMLIHDNGNIILPINPIEVQQIVIDMVNNGALRKEPSRKNIIRDAFERYYQKTRE